MEKGKTYEFIAPDGGYGYVILFSVFLTQSLINAYVSCYGIIYNNFFTELHMDSTDVTILSGIGALSCAFGSLMTSYIMNWISKRNIAFIGTFMWNSGLFIQAFSPSKFVMFLLQGYQNVGQGLVFNVSASSLNDYFVQKRSLALSIAQTLLALLCLLAPQAFQWCLNVYGHRSTVILLGAISLQMFVATALLQPVSWHMKKVEITPKENELKLLLQKTIDATSNEKDDKADKVEVKIPIKEKAKSTVFQNIIAFINSVIDLKLLKSLMLSVETPGATLCIVIELTFMMILPQALGTFDWNEDEIALTFSLVGIGDLVMRILLIVLNKWVNIWGSSRVFVFGILLGTVTRIGILTLLASNRIVIYCLFVICGMARCILMVVIMLVISDSVKPEEFSSALGVFMMSMGFLNLTTGPLFGAVRDYTQSYIITYYLMTAVMGAVGVIWTLKIIFLKKKKEDFEKSPIN